MNKPTQADRILEWLQTGATITPADAMNELGCYRLAARIHDLRVRGYDIQSNIRATRNRWGEEVGVAHYSMEIYKPDPPIGKVTWLVPRKDGCFEA